ncbi:peptidoglycan-binding protein [Sulfitobacter sp. LCG007]
MLARAVLTTLSLMLFPLLLLAQDSDRAVALVVSVGDGAARADAVQTQLQLMGVETLRVADPGNAQLRAILKRFAREATDARATFVYLDAPAVTFEGRGYVLPAGARLDRSTDLFTQAIPTLAFARSAALSAQGGAVLLTVAAPPADLPGGINRITGAPEPVSGASAVAVTGTDAFGPILTVLEAASRQEEVDVVDLLRGIASKNGVTLSHVPPEAVLLRAAPEPASEPPAEITPAAALEEVSEAAPEPTAETAEDLSILEQSLPSSTRRGIQRALREQGFYRGLVDGVFGPQTREAISAFQQSRSEDPTGLLTRRQLLALQS